MPIIFSLLLVFVFILMGFLSNRLLLNKRGIQSYKIIKWILPILFLLSAFINYLISITFNDLGSLAFITFSIFFLWIALGAVLATLWMIYKKR